MKKLNSLNNQSGFLFQQVQQLNDEVVRSLRTRQILHSDSNEIFGIVIVELKEMKDMS